MKKEVKVLGLSYSQSSTGSYIVVLSEKKGRRKLPIVIKPSEAQQIALKTEGMKSPRPLTHDLFKAITDSYMIDVQEVYIYTIAEGIFYTKLVTSNGLDEIEIDCTVGDGVALALVYECPLFVSKEVLDISGVVINDDGTMVPDSEIDEEEEDYIEDEPKRVVSIEDLEHMMQDAIQNEEYEIAAELRDRIDQLKNN
jgi:bifunctional DNase/RNase